MWPLSTSGNPIFDRLDQDRKGAVDPIFHLVFDNGGHVLFQGRQLLFNYIKFFSEGADRVCILFFGSTRTA
jgi:hypothetical protein